MANCGIAQSVYRPAENKHFEERPGLSRGLRRLALLLFFTECGLVFAAIHYWPLLRSVL